MSRIESPEYRARIESMSRDCYVISVDAMYPGGAHHEWWRYPDFWDRASRPRTPEAQAEMVRSMAPKMIATSSLKGGGTKLRPVHVERVQGASGAITVFLFPRSAALEGRTGKLKFQSSLKFYSLSATFDLKEMTQGPGVGL